jgi:hypothetical protein
MLFKYTFLIYTFIPLIILFTSSPCRKKLINIAVYLFLSLLISSPYYLIPLLNKTIFAKNIGHYVYNELDILQSYFRKLPIYLQALRQSQIGNIYFFLLPAAITRFIFNKSKNTSLTVKSIILIWLTIPYLIIIALPFPTQPVNPRHILPLLPVMALLISLFAAGLKNLKARYILYFFIVISASIHVTALSFKNFLYPRQKLISQKIYGDRFNFGLMSPYTIDLKQKDIFKTIAEFGPKIILIPDTPYPAFISSLELENALNNSPLDLIYSQFFGLKTAEEETLKKINIALTDSKCVIVIHSREINPRGMPEGHFAEYSLHTHTLLKKTFKAQQAKFTLYKTFILSDKDVYIYVKTNLTYPSNASTSSSAAPSE